MKAPCLFVLSTLCLLPIASQGQDETARHREVYAAINQHADGFKKVIDVTSVDDAGVLLTGYFEGKEVRKIVAKTGNDVTEYYLEKEKPLFVFSAYDQTDDSGKFLQRVEERMYFDKGEITKWNVNKDLGYVLHAEDYASQADALKRNTSNFLKVLKGKRETTEGVFLGIDQGDYFHWKMRDNDGKEVSLFILNADPSVEKVAEAPDAYLNKKCRVTWKRSKQELPEAGGQQEVAQIISVVWL
jgi:hypothetical protein